MYGQRLCGHVSLISHPYSDLSAPPLFRYRDPYNPLLSEDTNENKNQLPHIAIAVPPGDTDTYKVKGSFSTKNSINF